MNNRIIQAQKIVKYWLRGKTSYYTNLEESEIDILPSTTDKVIYAYIPRTAMYYTLWQLDIKAILNKYPQLSYF